MFAVFTTVLVFLVYILELFVAILQAYVYISLLHCILKILTNYLVINHMLVISEQNNNLLSYYYILNA